MHGRTGGGELALRRRTLTAPVSVQVLVEPSAEASAWSRLMARTAALVDANWIKSITLCPHFPAPTVGKIAEVAGGVAGTAAGYTLFSAVGALSAPIAAVTGHRSAKATST